MGTSVSAIIVVTTPALGIAPGPAIGLTVSNVSTVSVTLSWSPPSSGSTPFTYQPQISANNGVTWSPIGASTSATSTSVTGLSVNTNYQFRVITSNSTGSSTSAITNQTTLSVLPAGPTGLALVGPTLANSVSLQWNAPSTGTLPFTYQVLVRSPTGSGAFVAIGAPTTATTITISGLSPATSYDFVVTAANLAGTGQTSSALVNVMTTGGAGSLPGPATALVASSITPTSLVLTWTSPTTGTQPFSYQPQQSSPIGTPVWANIGTPVAVTTANVVGLTPNTSYIFQIVTTNTAGSSSSAFSSATTASVLPGAPTGLLSSGAPTTTSVPLAWTAPAVGTPPLTYQVSLRTPSGSGAFSTAAPLTGSVTQTVSGLTAGTIYDFEVAAINAAGTGPESVILLAVSTGSAVVTAPGPVTGLTISALTATTLTLSWTAPSSGTPPFTYQPQQSVDAGISWNNIGSGISLTTLAVTGLTANAAYQFRVNTTNATGTSTSSAVSTTTLSVPPTAPTSLAVVGSPTQTSITLQWSAPATGTPPLTYQLFFRTPSGSGTFLVAGPTTASLTQTASGLSPSLMYDFVVTATNVAGTSANSTTLVGISTAAATGVLPSAPTNLVASSITQSTVALTWSPPAAGSTPFQYVVQYQVQPVTQQPTPTALWTATTFTSVSSDRLTVSINQTTVLDQFATPYPVYGAPILTSNMYWEVLVVAPVNSQTSTTVGFGPLGGPETGGAQLFQWALNGVIAVDGGFGNGIQTWGSWTSGAVLCFAFDAVNRMLYGRVGATGNWNNSGTANPATNSGGYPVSSVVSLSGATAIVPAGQLYFFNSSMTAQFTVGSFIGAMPAGFSPAVPG